jgi:prepilin-type processing-associated H-X9-DG protein
VFAQAKESAKSTACLSNLKQLGIADKMYATDYDDGILPESTSGFLGGCCYASSAVNHKTGGWPNPDANSRLGRYWIVGIQTYVKSPDMMFCPSFSQAQFNTSADKTDCDGASTAEYYSPTVFNGPTYTLDVGHGGIISHYGVAFAATSGLPYGGTAGAYGCIYYIAQPIGTTTCPYYNMTGSGWFFPNGCSSGTCSIYQNLSETICVEPDRDGVFNDGLSNIYSSTGFSNTATGYPRPIEYFGCEGTGRHKGRGANYSFLDSHAKFLAVNMEDVLTNDPASAGNYYIKYMTYDK